MSSINPVDGESELAAAFQDFTKSIKDKPNFWQQFWETTLLAIPSVISLLFQFFAENINTYFVGHLSDSRLLAGVGFGNMTINIICIAPFLGLNGGIETFVS